MSRPTNPSSLLVFCSPVTQGCIHPHHTHLFTWSLLLVAIRKWLLYWYCRDATPVNMVHSCVGEILYWKQFCVFLYSSTTIKYCTTIPRPFDVLVNCFTDSYIWGLPPSGISREYHIAFSHILCNSIRTTSANFAYDGLKTSYLFFYQVVGRTNPGPAGRRHAYLSITVMLKQHFIPFTFYPGKIFNRHKIYLL